MAPDETLREQMTPCCGSEEPPAARPRSIQQELENRFTYHPPKHDQAARYEIIRYRAGELAAWLTRECPTSRELSSAVTHLEEAVFWANAAIARHE